MAKQFSFSELVNAVKEFNPDGALIDDSLFGEIVDWIPSGNYMVNAQLSGDLFKGYPAGRISQIAGESSTGKTFLALNAVREAQKKGYYVIYIDTEAAVDKEMIMNFGIDKSLFFYSPMGIIREVKNYLANMFTTMLEKRSKGFELPKIMVVIDSIGNLSSDKEINDALSGSDKANFTVPKEIKSLYRIMTINSSKLYIPIIVTNHVYDAMSMFPEKIIGGGKGNQYLPSVTLMLSKAQLKEDGTNKSGIIVTSKTHKNRFAKPIPIKFHISFTRGMNPYVGSQSYLNFAEHGVGLGSYKEVIDEIPVLDDQGNPVISRGKPKVNKVATGRWEFQDDPDSKVWGVKHLGGEIKAAELFTTKVFTEEVLENLNLSINEIFKYPKSTDDETLEELAVGEGLNPISDMSHQEMVEGDSPTPLTQSFAFPEPVKVENGVL